MSTIEPFSFFKKKTTNKISTFVFRTFRVTSCFGIPVKLYLLAAVEPSEMLQSALLDTTFCRPRSDPIGCGTALQVGR